MNEHNLNYNYLLRFAEIALKGKNKHFFINKLVENVRALAIAQHYKAYKAEDFVMQIKKFHNYLLISSNKELNLKPVFGIANYSKVFITDFNVEHIKSLIIERLGAFISSISMKDIKTETIETESYKPKLRSFRITVKRVDKRFLMHSNQLAALLGDVVRKELVLKVDLSNPDIEVLVELINGKAFISFEKIKSACGLPVGVEGSVIVVFGLTSIERDLLTYLMALKRGCEATIICLKDLKDCNLSQADKELLQSFSPKPLRILDCDNNTHNNTLANCFRNGKPLFTGLSFKELQDLCSKDTKLEDKLLKHDIFHPLIALSDEQVKQKLKEMLRLCKGL